MKNHFRQMLWVLALAITVTMFGAPAIARAQSQQGNDDYGWGQNRDERYSNNQRFDQGFKHGQKDRQHNRARRYRFRSNNDNDRQAYQSGYDRGYQNWNGTRGDHGNDRFNSNNHPGFRMGYTDGSTDGQRDRSLGRRAKYGPGYNHPDRGYASNYGDKGVYQQQYRVGYEQGYKEAFGN